MPFYFFLWTDDNIEHIAEHDVTPEEFETVVCNPENIESSRSSDRLVAFDDVDGRTLACVYEMADETTIYPVTAYEV